MRITVDGRLLEGIGAKDIALTLIAKIGANGAQGHAIEFAGDRDARVIDRGPADALQHVDRSRLALRNGRA